MPLHPRFSPPCTFVLVGDPCVPFASPSFLPPMHALTPLIPNPKPSTPMHTRHPPSPSPHRNPFSPAFYLPLPPCCGVSLLSPLAASVFWLSLVRTLPSLQPFPCRTNPFSVSTLVSHPSPPQFRLPRVPRSPYSSPSSSSSPAAASSSIPPFSTSSHCRHEPVWGSFSYSSSPPTLGPSSSSPPGSLPCLPFVLSGCSPGHPPLFLVVARQGSLPLHAWPRLHLPRFLFAGPPGWPAWTYPASSSQAWVSTRSLVGFDDDCPDHLFLAWATVAPWPAQGLVCILLTPRHHPFWRLHDGMLCTCMSDLRLPRSCASFVYIA